MGSGGIVSPFLASTQDEVSGQLHYPQAHHIPSSVYNSRFHLKLFPFLQEIFHFFQTCALEIMLLFSFPCTKYEKMLWLKHQLGDFHRLTNLVHPEYEEVVFRMRPISNA
jgi:hypothetical protein